MKVHESIHWKTKYGLVHQRYICSTDNATGNVSISDTHSGNYQHGIIQFIKFIGEGKYIIKFEIL